MVLWFLFFFAAGFILSNVFHYLGPEGVIQREYIVSLQRDIEFWRELAARNDAICTQALIQLDRLTGKKPSLFQRVRHLHLVEDE